MIDISKIRDVYPNYKEGQAISPATLVESMLILQNQEASLGEAIVQAMKEVDSLKFEFDKKVKERDTFIERASVELMANDKIPSKYLKNKELTAYYIKFGSEKKDEFAKINKECFDIEKKLVESRNVYKKYDTLSNVVHNAINTAIQVLSYLKHEQKAFNGSF